VVLQFSAWSCEAPKLELLAMSSQPASPPAAGGPELGSLSQSQTLAPPLVLLPLSAGLARGSADAWAGYNVGSARAQGAGPDCLADSLMNQLQLGNPADGFESLSFVSGSFHGQSDSGLWRMGTGTENGWGAPRSGLSLLDNLEGTLSSVCDGPISSGLVLPVSTSSALGLEQHGLTALPLPNSTSAPSQITSDLPLQRGRSSLEQGLQQPELLMGFLSNPPTRVSTQPNSSSGPLTALSPAATNGSQTSPRPSNSIAGTQPGTGADGPTRRTNQGYRKLWQQVGRAGLG
jgi:hypothetical protein